MKIMSIGNGFVAEHLPYDKIPDRAPLSDHWLELMLREYQPDVLINCIGKTGRPNIDQCETDREATATTNVALPILLAEQCAKKNIHMIQIGSGCIFYGQSPNMIKRETKKSLSGNIDDFDDEWINIDTGWKEDDFANPKSYYSQTKYACDLAIGSMSHITTLRIRMPISTKDHPRNLINKIKGYSQLIDIPNSITFMDDLVKCINWAAHNKPAGIFHVVNPQPLTAAQIMKEYQKYVPEHSFEIITENQLDQLTLAKRSNCILNSDKLQAAGFSLTHSSAALEQCMADYIAKVEK